MYIYHGQKWDHRLTLEKEEKGNNFWTVGRQMGQN